MIKVGIIGGAGYTGGEAIRLLLNHPDVKLAFVQSTSNGGNLLSDVHTDLLGETDMRFSPEISEQVDAVLLCVGHGDARKFLENIRSTSNIANPGCFATCLQLGLLPLAAAGLLESEIHISAATGSTGAGQKLAATSHFSWRANNISVYKSFEHQHLNEIWESIHALQPSFDSDINFIPYRGDFTREIYATIYTDSDLTAEQAEELYTEYYRNAAFTFVSRSPINLKQVINTNKCFVHVEKHGDKLMINSQIDNLLKGASGQAVQNLNMMFGLDEKSGLRLKPSAF